MRKNHPPSDAQKPKTSDTNLFFVDAKHNNKTSNTSAKKPLSSKQQEEALIKQLIESGSLNPQALYKAIQPLDFKSIQRRSTLSKLMTTSSGFTQAGRRSKQNQGKLIKRPLRSFSAERESQLLKQASTQLYFALENVMVQTHSQSKLVEAEMLHLTIGTKHFLFAAVNEATASKDLVNLISRNTSLKNLLTTAYKPRRNIEGQRRSKLYAKKLAQRVFDAKATLPGSTHIHDAEQVAHVANLLKSPWKTLDIQTRPVEKIIKLYEATEGGAYFIDNSTFPYKERHAEEFLTDIAEVMKAIAIKNKLTFRTSIAGKKRPCASCSGRMNGVIDHYNPRPGLLWQHAAARQSVPAFKRTAGITLFSPSHVSTDGRGRDAYDYNSGSDSEAETPLYKIPSPTARSR